MKTLIVYDMKGWAYHRRAEALRKYAPANCEVELVTVSNYTGAGDADIVLLLDYITLGLVQSMTPVRIPLVCTFSADAKRRQRQWRFTCEHADYVVALSRKRYTTEPCYRNTCCIANGVDFDDFHSNGIAQRGQRVLWIGKDSPDDNKGLRAVLRPLREMAGKAGFDCDFRVTGPQSRLMTPQLRTWYNSGTYIVCASLSEATANTVMEAAACGCVPVSTPVGTLTDWAQDGENCVLVKDRSPEAFLDGLQTARDARLRLASGAMEAVAKYDYRKVARLYFEEVLRPVAEGRTPERFCYLEHETWTSPK